MFRVIKKYIRSRRVDELDYETIVMDSKNLPEFDRTQMEGAIERSITRESFLILFGCFVVIVGVYILRLAYLQIIQGDYYSTLAEQNRLSSEIIFNNRGIIYDRNGIELAWNTFSDELDFPRRNYYGNPGFAHMLGYVSYPQQDTSGNYFSTQYQGISGLEYAYRERLNGTLGRSVREVDALGEVVASYAVEQPIPGENIYLAADSRIQSQLNILLGEYIDEQDFVGGSAVIMDAHTGHIIAMTSVPEYDSNILADGADSQTIAGYNADESLPFLNRVTGGSFAPGSVIKPFIAAGIVDQNLVDPEFKLFTDGTLEVANTFGGGETVFRDSRNNGIVNMYDAIAKSSNIYFMTFGGGFAPHKGLGIAGMNEYLRRFGLGEKTGLTEFREQSGLVPNPEWKRQTFGESWLLADTYFTAIGQYSFLSTPMQMAVAVAAIANDGDVLVPQLEINAEPQIKKNINISSADLDIVRRAMRQTVLRGTTRSLDLPFVEIASKSGTAERGVGRNQVNSWVMGFWPYQDPQYVFVAMTERGPQSHDYPVSRVMTRLFNWMENQGISEYY